MLFQTTNLSASTPPSTLERVGGKIFYIDSTASGATYTFYDQQKNIISDVRVGDAPYYYSVEGTGNKEKYYVFNNTIETGKRWTYQENGSWVYTYLRTGNAIGDGKANTVTVMSADGGKYVTELTGGDTIWAAINRLRTNVEGGCSDWFMPSSEEADALRTARDRGGNYLVTWFSETKIWSSSDCYDSGAWQWSYFTKRWTTDYGKEYAYGVFGVRSF